MSQAAIDFIPHQMPMVFIDELLAADEQHAVAKLTVRPELMFCEAEGLPTWTAIELMAQTISMYAGVQGRLHGLPPKIGFLLGTRKMRLPMPYFPLRGEIYIRVTKNYMHDNLAVFDCELTSGSHTITATLSVYEPDDVGVIEEYVN
ncbi:3-hydroxylacyl-ACP dehydratase [Acinetobacter puyangensis]|uniref:Predicted 3-hydroxylacyl-ACP dehydratase, HotDog domain n=1 Tax=Acinetobacter puyangensis TaxID=1096779 RepID=A0A240E4W7_9GAMM|nr:3-hydroxylacyl-ACP dehydratase [Acinetobacter puyangensis]SNX43249.1 Predicted 3-hydroxylacyl-ACP dehydratase, HotDog domain [Acinetobacter puyangensis]